MAEEKELQACECCGIQHDIDTMVQDAEGNWFCSECAIGLNLTEEEG